MLFWRGQETKGISKRKKQKKQNWSCIVDKTLSKVESFAAVSEIGLHYL